MSRKETTASMSATDAKVNFGKLLESVEQGQPVMIFKNDKPTVVCISLDDYEDYLEINDKIFNKGLEKSKKEISTGKYLGIEALYDVHRETIKKEANYDLQT